MRLEPFAAGDVPAVAELHARARPRTAWSSQEARARYFREALLENPWADPELPSLVAKDGERVVGFFGVVPRRMRFGERRLRVAVGCQFMVDPQERNGLVALRLMRAFLGGRQDVSVADWATEASRSLWLAAGGSASVLQEQQWMLLLRPVQSLWQHAMRARPVVAALGAPLAALADACASPLL
ncbi:MAG TPA: GNAT family N-acetyltransferase, partial [Burkholderiales bacterium]|nr:GNAT family N-acetyltransferase [Burkholderiales bacterium]